MLASSDCLPTPLFPSRKNPFWDNMSDSNSGSDSRNGSLNDLQGFSDLGVSPIDRAMAHESADFLNSKPLGMRISFILEEDNEDDCWEEIYEKADAFLDEEGLDIVSPSPVLHSTRAKPTLITTFSASFFTKSEQSTAIDGDSPSSGCQSFSGPTFWARRTISGGLNKTTLGLLTTQIKSEPLLEFESPEAIKHTQNKKIYNFQNEMKAFHCNEVFSKGF